LLKFKLNLNYTLTLKVRPSSNLKDIGTQIDNTIKFDVNLSLTVTPLEVQLDKQFLVNNTNSNRHSYSTSTSTKSNANTNTNTNTNNW